ncbi:heterokaryon incompatibility protein domain-containing protein [Neurospora intermedia]|uniref:Heterokaryon incompatibility protein domain-containing protein n=1 Tax=Neurospora intermedia TaxID=5142 RepID=A0ABR3DUH9_NEUIN
MIYRGATGDHLCLECNEIKEIFDFEASIPVRFWRTLDLLAHIDRSDRVTKGLWELKKNMDKACSFCSFLMNCASRMATHTTVDLNSENWFLALGVRTSAFVAGNASGERPANLLSTQVLELCLRKMPYHQDPFMIQWKDVYLILPAQAYNDGHDEITDTIDWELIHKWLGTCHSEHANCHTSTLATITLENIPSFFLIDCERETIVLGSGMRNLKYVTLSYVWGASTTSPQVLDASTSLPVLPDSNQRPKVVNDAMEAVRRIEYRYLWVDRYCIPQSDHDAKSKQIKNMGRIYSMSILTIIAAAGSNAEYGLPGVTSPPSLQLAWTTLRSGNRAMPFIYFEPPNKDILRSTWNSRGWTYQEALLSKRRLVFTDRHVYFQCESIQSIGYLYLRLDPQKGWPYSVEPAKGSEVFPFRWYYGTSSSADSIWDLINDYRKRMLSFEHDAIHAVQGILESFRSNCDLWLFYGLPVMGPNTSDIDNLQSTPSVFTDRELALGLAFRPSWEVHSGMQELLGSLLWMDRWDTTVALHQCQETGLSDQAELRRIGFPSWTWAGWKTANNSVEIIGHTRGYYTLGSGVTPKYNILDGFSFEIHVSYDDLCLTWPRDYYEIRRRSGNISQFPDFLIISGPVFDVSISCTNADDQCTAGYPTRPAVWKYTSPPFLARATYKGPPFSINEVRGDTIDLLALYLHSKALHEPYSNTYIHTLLLRPVGEDVHGQIYERVTCVRVSPFEAQWGLYSLAEGLNLRQMELRIR